MLPKGLVGRVEATALPYGQLCQCVEHKPAAVQAGGTNSGPCPERGESPRESRYRGTTQDDRRLQQSAVEGVILRLSLASQVWGLNRKESCFSGLSWRKLPFSCGSVPMPFLIPNGVTPTTERSLRPAPPCRQIQRKEGSPRFHQHFTVSSTRGNVIVRVWA